MGGFVGALIGGVVAVVMAVPLMRARARRLQPGGKAECSIRVVNGAHDGLSHNWWGGLATLSPGGIHFVSYIGGLRFLRRSPVWIQVVGVDASRARSPQGRELVTVSPGTSIIVVITPTATLEWAVLKPQLEWAQAQVTQLP